jgi:GNAT superfamily N-acetyltransferase
LTPGYVIRAVDERDFSAWKPLWDGYNAFYGRSGETALAEDITRETWSRFLAADEPMHALVAERDGQLLGLAHYLFHRSTINRANSCYLQDLFTVPPARGMGIGRALIEAVYFRAREAGAARAYWQTHETNTTAMQLYDQLAEKSGFIVYRKPL